MRCTRGDTLNAIEPLADTCHLVGSGADSVRECGNLFECSNLSSSKFAIFIGEDLLDTFNILNQQILIFDSGRNDMVKCHIYKHARLNLYLLQENLVLNLVACLQLNLIEYSAPLE